MNINQLNSIKMKKSHSIVARIASLLFYCYIYFGLHFDLLSCVVGFLFLLAITQPVKTKKPEAATSSF